MSDRCWFCGEKLVDSSRLKNVRQGVCVTIYRPTGEKVCRNGCPSKEQWAEIQKEKEEFLRDGQ